MKAKQPRLSDLIILSMACAGIVSFHVVKFANQARKNVSFFLLLNLFTDIRGSCVEFSSQSNATRRGFLLYHCLYIFNPF